MRTTTLVCILSIGIAEARRSETNLLSASEQRMTASEAVRKGLIVANDYVPQATTQAEPSAFAEIREHSDIGANTSAKTNFCPKMKGKNAICDGNLPCDVRNLAYVTCLNAENLPSKWNDKVDPYVYFWVENKENKASTPAFDNNEKPTYDFGCPFAYDGALNFDGEVRDSNILKDGLVGEVASSGGIKIDEHFLQQFDTNGDGRFELGLFIYKNGKKVRNKKTNKDSIVRFRFELIKAPGYELRRIGFRPAAGAGSSNHVIVQESNSRYSPGSSYGSRY